MSEMIERVATAIHRAMPGREGSRLHLTPATVLLARAAIEAMREPTGEMINAGAGTFEFTAGQPSVAGQPSMSWRAMIDAALSSTERPPIENIEGRQ